MHNNVMTLKTGATMARERTEVFQMRLTPDEHELLMRVAKRLNMPVARFVRGLVVDAARRLDQGDAEGYRNLLNSTAVYHISVIGGTPAGLTRSDNETD